MQVVKPGMLKGGKEPRGAYVPHSSRFSRSRIAILIASDLFG